MIGLWWGLSTGLIICGVALLVAWSRRIDAASALPPHTEPLNQETIQEKGAEIVSRID